MESFGVTFRHILVKGSSLSNLTEQIATLTTVIGHIQDTPHYSGPEAQLPDCDTTGFLNQRKKSNDNPPSQASSSAKVPVFDDTVFPLPPCSGTDISVCDIFLHHELLEVIEALDESSTNPNNDK